MDIELPMEEVEIIKMEDVNERITSLKKKIREAHSAKKQVYVGTSLEEGGRRRQIDHYNNDGMRGVMYYTKIAKNYKYKNNRGEYTGIKAAENELIDYREGMFQDKKYIASGQSIDLKGSVYVIVGK
jgi:hypothetical protein